MAKFKADNDTEEMKIIHVMMFTPQIVILFLCLGLATSRRNTYYETSNSDHPFPIRNRGRSVLFVFFYITILNFSL